MDADLTPLQRWGVLAWAVRPAYLVIEVLVAIISVGGYSFVDDTVSDLGISRFSDVPAVMNASFIVFGALMAFGAVALFGRFGRGPMGVAASVLLVVSGISSIAVGLTPLDQYPDGHVLAATPLFIAQPAALVLLGLAVRHRRPTTGVVVVGTGVVCAVAALAFIAVDDAAGLTERIALWPVFVVLAVLGLQERRSR
ncbi:DUF998 domain-containing protein [Aeromicrobium sp. CF3.5]|uniref:DUF998 domain-containing protein n=1 Tax=Aeromicrobium sp. CF3.5 TaxID=3373078 RepID=UPI003EE7681C